MRFLLIFFSLFYFSEIPAKENKSCDFYTEKYGKIYNLPNKLLTSISLVESGLKKKDNFKPWPWTLNIAGKSKYFNSKSETVNYLKESLRKSKNADIGCMQINYKYHGHMFNDIEQMLNPENNVKYAAEFLRKLFTKYKSWNEAISRYHSSQPDRKKKYLMKVKNYWDDLRQKKIKISNYKNDQINKDKVKYFRDILKNERLKI